MSYIIKIVWKSEEETYNQETKKENLSEVIEQVNFYADYHKENLISLFIENEAMITKEKKKYYAVPEIDVEFGWGSRPDGFYVYDDLEIMKEETKRRIKEGGYSEGYIGPVKPPCFIEFFLNDSIKTEEFENLKNPTIPHKSKAVAFYDKLSPYIESQSEYKSLK